jgi:hypothetical protein
VKRALALIVIALLALACSSKPSTPPGAHADAASAQHAADAAPAQHAADAAPAQHSADAAAATSAGDAGNASSAPCSAQTLAEPKVATTYYVAIDEPGADNTACDGLAPSDQGAGHCPFKDLTSPRTRALLDGVAGVRVELRQGSYVLSEWEGLHVTGTGTSPDQSAILSSYRGEHVVLDTAIPDGTGCSAANATPPPGCVRQVVRVSGQYTIVQGITIQNGLGYQLEVFGGSHHVIRCNRLLVTQDFAMRSDMLKGDAHASEVEVSDNEFSDWSSGAIDITAVGPWTIERNQFHDPRDPNANVTGGKFGTHDILVRDNTIHDMAGTGEVFSLGGTGSPHPDDYEAYRIHIVGNHISRAEVKVAQFVSCQDCTFENNDVADSGAGVLLSSAANGLPECSASPTGCKPTTGARISGNRFRNLDGAGKPAQANVFVYADSGETDFVAADNTYCSASASDARFGLMGSLVSLAAWQMGTGTDASSKALAVSDPACSF